jgi:hypothetical protein
LPLNDQSLLDGQSNAGGHNNKMHLDSLISFDHQMVPTSTNMIMNSPISSPGGLMSPPSTGNTQVENRIFQFPPTTSSAGGCSSGLGIKQEEWHVPCLQDSTSGFTTHHNQSSSADQCSPMAISPSMSTLNTPRGSITSMRSQHSPMNTDQPVGHQPLSSGDPMMSYEVFDAEATAFVSYTTVSHHQSTTNYFPSPPRSPIVTSTTSFGGQQQQPPQQPPPCYDEYYGGLSGIGSSIEHQQQQPTAAASNDFFTSITKTEADSVFMHSSVMTNYGSTPDPTESFVSSDTCPETPDSSVKEEADVNSPDTGSYVCLWMECHEEFVTQKALVEHISDNHMESKKGCEEFPCLWKVSNS